MFLFIGNISATICKNLIFKFFHLERKVFSICAKSDNDEAEEIKNIIEKYIYVDDEKAFKKCRKKWDEEMIIGIDGVQWIPENVGEIVAFTDEINKMLARLDKDEDVGIESYGLFCNMDEFFSAQIYADNEEKREGFLLPDKKFDYSIMMFSTP